MIIKILLIIIIAYALGCIPLPSLICSRLPVKDEQAPAAYTYPQVLKRHGWLGVGLVLAGDLIRALVIILLGGLLLKAYPGIGRRTALLFGIVGQALPVTNAMRARHGLVFPALLLLWTDWRLFLIALVVFLGAYIATKRISVSTLAAAVSFIIFSLVLGTWLWGVKLILAVLAAAALVLPYWGNLRRYFSGLKKKKSGDEEGI